MDSDEDKADRDRATGNTKEWTFVVQGTVMRREDEA